MKIPSCLTVLLFLVVMTMWSGFASAQSDMMIEDISAKTGLPKGSINCIEQDPTGFVWIGTWKGLFRYDGYSVVNFSKINPGFMALKISEVFVCGEDLWVGSFVTGLFRIDLTDYRFTHYHTQAEADWRISNNDILTISSVPGGPVLVGTERGGLIVIGEDHRVEKILDPQTLSSVVSNQQISKVVVFSHQEVVFGSNFLTFYNLETGLASNLTFPPRSNYLTDFYRISDQELYVGTNAGFFRIKRSSAGDETEQILDIRTNSILKVKGYGTNNFFLGTSDGVYEFNADTRSVRKFYFNQSEKTSNQNITKLKYTDDDAILIGSENGLFSLVKRKQHFNSIGLAGTDGTQPIITSIKKAGAQYFAGSWGQGIFLINRGLNQLEPVRFPESEAVASMSIYALEVEDKNIWFSCKNHHGVFSFDYSQTPFQLKYHQFFINESGEKQQYIVTSMLYSDYWGLMLGTWEGLLFFQDKLTGQFKAITDKQNHLPSTRNFSIYSMVEDKDHNVWLSANGGGVVRLSIEDQKIKQEFKLTRSEGLISNFVTQVYQTRNNRIWIGTEEGLSYFENGRVESVFPKDVVIDVQSMKEDPIGFLWLGTQNGIIRINSNQPDEPYKLFDQADGLSNQSFYINCIEQDENFTFYFGGFKGIDYFTPYKIEYNYRKPIPRLTGFALSNQKVFPATPEQSILKVNIQQTRSIKLKHNQNTFSIEFGNLEYQIPEKCQFAYKLSGIDEDWNFRNSNNRMAYYTKLAPGEYTFQVKSTNNDGVWSEEPTKLSIRITRPFWATTWAYLVYFIVVMLLFFFYSYSRVSRIEAQHRQQLKEIEYGRQRELDELKLKFFTNISHEFRTPLTLILGPVARIIRQEKNDPFHEQHMMIFRNANRLLHLTNRIMDFRKSEKDQLKLQVQPGNLSEFVYNIFLFFKYEADNRQINYRFKTNWEGTIWFDCEFVESMVFNLLSNAFKYTPDGRNISLIVSQIDEWVSLSFNDTGRGIDPNEQDLIFERFYSTANYNSAGIGLSFTKRLAELHKGRIELTSQPGTGSVFTLYLPLHDVYSEQEKSKTIQHDDLLNLSKIDIDSKNRAAEQSKKLKSIFVKDELIALIVDDNLDVRKFIRTLLEDQFRVIEADNGEEGFSLAILNLPDIVISDVMMPGISGLELCERLKNDVRTDHIPVILTTVLSEQSDRIEGLKVGADSYIPKPIDPDHLLIRVNKLIERQLKLKEKFKIVDYLPLEDEENKTENSEGVHPLIERAREIVLKNIDNSEYSIDDFCAEIGLSRMQLYRKFKAITGLSANSFIRKVRLHRASELLKTGKYSVKEVTYDVGFTDLKYFRKCFYEEFGANPSEFSGH